MYSNESTPSIESKTPKTQYEIERDDAASRLGIKIGPDQIEVCIYMGVFTGESLTIARAIQDLRPKIIILGHMIGKSVTYILSEGQLIQGGSSTVPIYSLGENSHIPTPLHGNYGNFKRVSENKRLTSLILKNAKIPVPKEISLSRHDYRSNNIGDNGELKPISQEDKRRITTQRTRQVKEFCKSLGDGKKVVLKPIDGQCGINIRICERSELTEDLINEYQLSVEGDILVQEKIDSYKIFDEEGRRKDWNVRVLLTTDDDGEIIVFGITGRIDYDGGPVNRSITADNISLEKIAELAKWTETELQEVKSEIELIAIDSIRAIKAKIKSSKSYHSQDLAGVDIIVGEDMKPSVIEVNDSDSGCVYELMCLEGIASIYPLACAITNRVEYVVEVKRLFEILEPVFGPYAGKLSELIVSRDIEMKNIECGFQLKPITDEGGGFIKIMDADEKMRSK